MDQEGSEGCQIPGRDAIHSHLTNISRPPASNMVSYGLNACQMVDGKGNKNHNVLPKCQLQKIHNYIKKLYKSPRLEARPLGLMFGPLKSLGVRDA
jgi:hypothetical protein